MRILIIDDDRSLRDSLSQGLRSQGYQVETAADGSAGFARAAEHDFDLLVLDRMLPGLDGIEVLRRLRRSRSSVPVLLLSARNGVHDRIEGLDAGADDYLPKPFAVAELLARIRALLRRREQLIGPRIEIGDLLLDVPARQVQRAGVAIVLTPRELHLLEILAARPGLAVSAAAAAEQLYGRADAGTANAIEVLVGRLRRKLHRPGLAPVLHTRRGFGYVLAVDAGP